jgi:hypothetical protein
MDGEVDNVARSELVRVLAAKIDESSGENLQDFAVRTQPNFAGSSRRVSYPFTRSSFQGKSASGHRSRMDKHVD